MEIDFSKIAPATMKKATYGAKGVTFMEAVSGVAEAGGLQMMNLSAKIYYIPSVAD